MAKKEEAIKSKQPTAKLDGLTNFPDTKGPSTNKPKTTLAKFKNSFAIILLFELDI